MEAVMSDAIQEYISKDLPWILDEGNPVRAMAWICVNFDIASRYIYVENGEVWHSDTLHILYETAAH